MWGPTGRLTPAGTDCQPELRTVPRVGLASVSRRRLLEPRSGYPWAGFRFGEEFFVVNRAGSTAICLSAR
jgi:hypothetical protein